MYMKLVAVLKYLFLLCINHINKSFTKKKKKNHINKWTWRRKKKVKINLYDWIFWKKKCQQGLGSIGKDRSLHLTSLGSILAASGLLLVGILSEGWPSHTDGEKSVRRLVRGYNTTIRAHFLFNKKNIYISENKKT